nr:hypothetical protein [Dermatobacter hominis]
MAGDPLRELRRADRVRVDDAETGRDLGVGPPVVPLLQRSG